METALHLYSGLLVGVLRKSTYCRILLPPELRFGYADSLDFSSKQEAERALGRFFLINLDEFDQITVNQQGFLKHLLQKPTANLRKPYGTSVRELRRYASFIGTSNQKDLLTDPTGSRRFICIEVTDPIDTNVTIDYRQLYAQAMHLLYKNERYWLNDEDEAVLRQSNSEFEQISPLEAFIHCNFFFSNRHACWRKKSYNGINAPKVIFAQIRCCFVVKRPHLRHSANNVRSYKVNAWLAHRVGGSLW